MDVRLSLFAEINMDQKVPKKALAEVLDVHCVKKVFFEDIFNEITTSEISLEPQNLSETTQNACFEL